MPTRGKKRNTKVSVTLEENTLAAIQNLQKKLPAGTLPDMVRYLMMRGIEAVQQQSVLPK
jgi:hypothetical protein